MVTPFPGPPDLSGLYAAGPAQAAHDCRGRSSAMSEAVTDTSSGSNTECTANLAMQRHPSANVVQPCCSKALPSWPSHHEACTRQVQGMLRCHCRQAASRPSSWPLKLVVPSHCMSPVQVNLLGCCSHVVQPCCSKAPPSWPSHHEACTRQVQGMLRCHCRQAASRPSSWPLKLVVPSHCMSPVQVNLLGCCSHVVQPCCSKALPSWPSHHEACTRQVQGMQCHPALHPHECAWRQKVLPVTQSRLVSKQSITQKANACGAQDTANNSTHPGSVLVR